MVRINKVLIKKEKRMIKKPEIGTSQVLIGNNDQARVTVIRSMPGVNTRKY
jgi:hypothetical protein